MRRRIAYSVSCTCPRCDTFYSATVYREPALPIGRWETCVKCKVPLPWPDRTRQHGEDLQAEPEAT